MKISRIIKDLTNIMKKYGDLDCVYTIDEEGNAYHKVYFRPSIGRYSEAWYEYLPEQDFQILIEDGTIKDRDYERVACVN